MGRMVKRAGRTTVTDRTRRLEDAGLLLLLAVAGLRPLISESYDLAGTELTSSLAGVADPLPLATLFIDAAIILGALTWAVSHALSASRRYRWSGLEPGLALVLVGVVISCLTAANRRVAINASVDWLAMALLAIACVQLLTDARRLRWALCVLAASGAAQAYQCYEQVYVSFAETAEMYQAHREEIWGAQGVPMDAPQVELFERRMAAREASGSLAHSNVAAAHLLVSFFAVLALFSEGRRLKAGRARGLAVMALAVAVLGAIRLTHGLGALVACAAGVGLAGMAWLGRGWIDRRRRAVLRLGWVVIVAGTLAVVGHGVVRGSLPGESLNFRWGYWTASAELIRDHLWTGVGRENFGNAYLTYKSIAWPEEVKNPHNFLVTAASEWGLAGLVGMVLMLAGGSITMTRVMSGVSPGDTVVAQVVNATKAGARTLHSAAGTAAPQYGGQWRWMLLLAVTVFAPRWFLLGSTDANFRYVSTVVPAAVWLVAFAICARVPDPMHVRTPGGAGGLPTLLSAGVSAFLLQDTINFAWIVPGAATPFFLMVAAAIAVRMPATASGEREHAPGRGLAGWLPAAALAAVLLVLLTLLMPPVWRAGGLLSAARQVAGRPLDGQANTHPAWGLYERATAADPLDPAAPTEWADWLRRAAASSPEPVAVLRQAMDALEVASGRNPLSASLQARRAMTALAAAGVCADAHERSAWLESAVRFAERAVELYPSKPAGHLDLAACRRAAGEDAGRADLIRAALDEYRYALALDAQRPPWETIRRLRPRQVAEAEANIARLEAWLAER